MKILREIKITDNPSILRLLQSANIEDILVGLALLNRNPDVDFEYKMFLYIQVPVGIVEYLYTIGYSSYPDWRIQTVEERCKLWTLIPKENDT